jgi:hypothetical protein
VVAIADTIRLRDGSVLRGKVVSYNQRQFTIIVYIGSSQSRHVISVDEIESVEFDGGDAMARAEPQGGAAPPTIEPIARNRGGAARELPQPDETPVPSNPPPVTADPPAGAVTEPDAGAVPVIAEKTVSVAAAADWTSTEIRVQRGQRIVISATGDVDLGDGQRSDPAGLASLTSKQMMKNRPIGALIAVIGDDNDEFIFIGRSSEFTAKSNGILFLTINDDNVKDNAGAYIARVRVLSNR